MTSFVRVVEALEGRREVEVDSFEESAESGGKEVKVIGESVFASFER
jgi:hypothetical protein